MTITIELFILNYNGEELIEECVNSFEKILDKDSNITIIDNGSHKDNSLNIIKKYKHNKIFLKKNLGFPGGFNEGIKRRKSNADWYCLISNDVINLNRNILKKFRKDITKHPNIGIMGCYFILPNKKNQKSGGKLKLNGLTQPVIEYFDTSKNIIEMDFVNGALFFIKKEVWEMVKGFDMIYYPYLSEEIDLEIRVKKLGFKVIKNKNLKFLHKHSATINNEISKATIISKRNAGILKLIHYPISWIIISFILEIKSILNVFIIRKNGKLNIAKKIHLRFKTLITAYIGIIKKIPEIIKSRARLSRYPYK